MAPTTISLFPEQSLIQISRLLARASQQREPVDFGGFQCLLC